MVSPYPSTNSSLSFADFPYSTDLADDVSVYEVLRKALDDLTDLCDAVEEKFTAARDEYNEANPDR